MRTFDGGRQHDHRVPIERPVQRVAEYAVHPVADYETVHATDQ